MLDAVLAIVTGGATGLLGTALSFVTNYFQAKQKHAQEVELRKLDAEVAKIESAGYKEVAQIEAESAEAKSAWKALEESYREAARRWSRPDDGFLMMFVDFCRGMTRPMLTWAFVAITAAVYFTVGAQDAKIHGQIIDTVLYLTTTTVLWWFGARQISKGPAR